VIVRVSSDRHRSHVPDRRGEGRVFDRAFLRSTSTGVVTILATARLPPSISAYAQLEVDQCQNKDPWKRTAAGRGSR
jgi:hypothetical protein